ncbi:MAG: 16S rRNA (uracil(1498)-N(3))-methyltransferase [Rhodothermales bacterium]|nr:16S rRNA (uracil(1498)-N(3))-methyltransferase [Rhodothermales bacterium]MBO6780177.1 16S rRNA (uracil(1498)-N(3))-methyltransferase [Rhodothermales bacterium]
MIPKHTFHVFPPVVGDRVDLPEREAQHARRVLRLRPGDGVCLVDGLGNRFVCALDDVTAKAVRARIVEREALPRALPRRVTIGAALLKNAGRFETMLEKVAELGGDAVVPLLTERAERTRFRLDRAESILVGAMKQSGSAWLTRIVDPEPLSQFIGGAPEHALRLICHEAADPKQGLVAQLLAHPDQDVIVAVGPEGGFSEEEIGLAQEAGFQVCSLGPTRLRAETASMAAMATIAQVSHA